VRNRQTYRCGLISQLWRHEKGIRWSTTRNIRAFAKQIRQTERLLLSGNFLKPHLKSAQFNLEFRGERDTWFRHYATIRKVVGSIHDEVDEFFAIYLILPAALALGLIQPLTETVTRKSFWGVEHGRCVGLTSPPSVSRLQCGIMNISQSYRPPRPFTGIDLFLLYSSILCLISAILRVFVIFVSPSSLYCNPPPSNDQFRTFINW
jgi:hypothetical protein